MMTDCPISFRDRPWERKWMLGPSYGDELDSRLLSSSPIFRTSKPSQLSQCHLARNQEMCCRHPRERLLIYTCPQGDNNFRHGETFFLVSVTACLAYSLFDFVDCPIVAQPIYSLTLRKSSHLSPFSIGFKQNLRYNLPNSHNFRMSALSECNAEFRPPTETPYILRRAG